MVKIVIGFLVNHVEIRKCPFCGKKFRTLYIKKGNNIVSFGKYCSNCGYVLLLKEKEK